MNTSLKNIVKEISGHATKGRVGLNENVNSQVTEQDVAATIVNEFYKGRYTLDQIVEKLSVSRNNEVTNSVIERIESYAQTAVENGAHPDDDHEKIEEYVVEKLSADYNLDNLKESKKSKTSADKICSQILKEISSHAKQGRMLFEAPDPLSGDEEEEEDPFAGDEEGGEDPLGGSDGGDPMGDMGDMGDANPEDAKSDAEAEKYEAEADAAEAEADAAKAKAEKEKSEAEREMADAKSKEFNGTELFTRPGVSVLLGLLLDKYQDDADGLSALAGQLIAKLRLDDKGVEKLKSQWGPMIPLHGSAELMNKIENQIPSATDDDVDQSVKNS